MRRKRKAKARLQDLKDKFPLFDEKHLDAVDVKMTKEENTQRAFRRIAMMVVSKDQATLQDWVEGDRKSFESYLVFLKESVEQLSRTILIDQAAIARIEALLGGQE